jgi:hypothetical protein
MGNFFTTKQSPNVQVFFSVCAGSYFLHQSTEILRDRTQNVVKATDQYMT